jgi:DNA-binding response OmpR family regulator
MPRVLVVDDSPMDRRLAGGILSKNGFEVAYAEDGRSALAEMASELPSVVVTDLQMPEMDGLALVAESRRRHPSVPIVIMTAHGSEETALVALRSGAASYVPKRLLAQSLVRTLREILSVTVEPERASTLDPLEVRSVTYELGPDVTRIGQVVSELELHLIQLGLCDETGIIQVGVALREALVNAVVHGNLEVSSKLHDEAPTRFADTIRERQALSPYKDRVAKLVVTYAPREAAYHLSDQGPGFDLKTVPDPTAIENLDKPFGRGLMLIRTFMDDVTFNERGNEIRMVKRKA